MTVAEASTALVEAEYRLLHARQVHDEAQAAYMAAQRVLAECRITVEDARAAIAEAILRETELALNLDTITTPDLDWSDDWQAS